MSDRWENLNQSWEDRTFKLINMLPEVNSLLEFGQGKGNTRHILSNIKYTGSDLFKRHNDTIICNLNERPLPAFEVHDVILISGVLEYLYNIKEVITHLSQYTKLFCISYAGADNHLGNTQIIEGWQPCISYKELIEIFMSLGFTLVNKDQWGKQSLFLFQKNSNLETWKQLQEEEYFKNHRCYQGLHLAKPDPNLIKEIEGKVIVEIGCGYGRETSYFSQYADTVYAIDVSKKILDLMKEIVTQYGNIDKVIPVEAEYFTDIINEPIDFVYSQYVFQHITPLLAKRYINYFRPLLQGKLQILFRVGNRKLFPEGKEPLVEYTYDEIKELLKDYQIIDIVKNETSTYKLWNVTAI